MRRRASRGEACRSRTSSWCKAASSAILRSARRQQGGSVAQYLPQSLGEAHERRAVDDVVIDAENEMDDVALDQLAVVERRFLLDRTDRQRQRHGRDRYPAGAP